MILSIFFGILLAVLFFSTLPITGSLFVLGLKKIGRTIEKESEERQKKHAEDILEKEKKRLAKAQEREKREAGINPFLWSFKKSMLFTAFIFFGLLTIIAIEHVLHSVF
jgi:hypothetical protein